MKTGSIVAVALLCASPAFAQIPASKEIWKHLEIRQNTNVKRDVAKPAFVTFTIPDEGANTYQIGLGALWALESTDLFDIDALVDYQRNNASDSEQDVLKLGATGERQLWAMSNDGHHQVPLITFRGDFKRDGVKEVNGWQGAVGYTHLFRGARPAYVPNVPHRFGKALETFYVPYLGLEFEGTDDVDEPGEAEEDDDTEGMTTRFVAQVSASFVPAYDKLQSNLEFIISYAFRKDLQHPSAATDTTHPIFGFEANYLHKIGRAALGFGVSYLNGEDPDAGFAQQSYWEFSLKMRVK
jgi:hypothetical protein